MNQIGAYILSVICAAAICAIVMHFFEGKGAMPGALKLAAGIFLTYTVVNPIALWSGGSIDRDYLLTFDASAAVNQGQNMTRQALSEIIKSRCEAYIVNKAEEMDLSLTVSVALTDDELPAPKTVTISGSVSPYKKVKLQAILVNDLGIQKENQQWI